MPAPVAHKPRLAALALTALVSTVPAAAHAQYFNQFHGGCGGARMREQLVRRALLGTWVSSGDQVETYGGREHFTARSGTDRETDCEDCCRRTYHYDATITFRGGDAFGNVTGSYQTTITNSTANPDPAFMARHNRVYSVDCGQAVHSSAGTVAVSLEVIVLQNEPGVCNLSGITLRRDGGDDSYRLDMIDPRSFKRDDGRIYQKR